jgi:hypothetical protein
MVKCAQDAEIGVHRESLRLDSRSRVDMHPHPGAARVRGQICSSAAALCGTASRCRPETKRTGRTGFSWGEGMAGEGEDEVRAAQASTNRDSEARHQTTDWAHATGAPWPALALSRLDYTDYSLTRPPFCLYTRPRRTCTWKPSQPQHAATL